MDHYRNKTSVNFIGSLINIMSYWCLQDKYKVDIVLSCTFKTSTVCWCCIHLVYQAISAPFVFYHPQVHRDVLVQDSWLGHIDAKDWGVWADGLLLLIFGGIPWQVFILSIQLAVYLWPLLEYVVPRDRVMWEYVPWLSHEIKGMTCRGFWSTYPWAIEDTLVRVFLSRSQLGTPNKEFIKSIPFSYTPDFTTS